MKDESAFHLLCDCPSLISLRMRIFSKPILGFEEYEGAPGSALLRFTLASGRFTVTPRFIHSYEHFFFLYCLILSVCLFVSSLIFRFFICVVHIKPACGDFISPTFNPSIHMIRQLLDDRFNKQGTSSAEMPTAFASQMAKDQV
jgi:hypothetical protein